ncbi:MBL fold metallo-hydrolase [Streptomyces zagrosensis]|uniref:Glyoxylase-like metal-dependent hydrolase (Beta-lactamase superfamily II) n=1 Tax=Streptomyces zagrosensis TaxID=1042984 RepID=A0A7W9UWU4_9ACTN|nr:MBL fold metallo-hydrolase [Streptomyces zagrosensis]MBB5933029.1 glyoxylase-like metal-dependent hydrolase (beta-lactamase superfamily II) [Streptomyces zagrosensis]
MESSAEEPVHSRWEMLAPGVARRRLPGWDATVGAVAGATGVLVVDTGATLGAGAEIRREVRALFGRPVTHVVLTHPHFDHVLGAAAFAGVQVYGAAGLDGVLLQEREALCADAVRHGAEPDAVAEAADHLVRPGHLVCGELTLGLGGGREVLLANVGPGHTAYDLAVLVPGSPEVVFCGDLVEESDEPQAGPDALPAQWPAALDRLLALGGADAMYVPGHGAVVDAAFVRQQRETLARRFAVP